MSITVEAPAPKEPLRALVSAWTTQMLSSLSRAHSHTLLTQSQLRAGVQM